MDSLSLYSRTEVNVLFRQIFKSEENTIKKEWLISDFLAGGANINQQDIRGNTFLHRARSVEEINLLLKFGADINIRNFAGETPLLRFIKYVNRSAYVKIRRTSPIIKEFLNYNPNVNLKDRRGCSPLFAYLLSHDCDITIIKRFVQLGAAIDIRYSKRNTLLHAAVRNQYCKSNIVQYLLEIGLDPNSENSDKQTALHCCVKMKNFNLDIINELIKSGAKVMKDDSCAESPLQSAVMNPYCTKELLKALVCNNPDLINVKVVGDYTPLHLAATHKMNVEELIACGADVNAVTVVGCTPLHLAFGIEHDKKSVKVLLKHGADVNAVTVNQFTPLHFAVIDPTCNEKIVSLLLEYGADINAISSSGHTPLHLVINNPSCNEKIVNVLVKNGADVNTRCVNNISLLHSAFRITANVNIIKTLLEFNADLCALDDDRGIPFNYSLFNHNFSNSFLMELLSLDIDFVKCLNITANHRNVLLMYFYNDRKVLLKTMLKYLILKCYSSMSVGKCPAVVDVFFKKVDIKTCNIYSAFYRSCMAEINAMRADLVSDSITFYDIMTQKFSHLTLGQSNDVKEKIIGTVLFKITGNKYPTYRNMVTYVKKEDFLKNLDSTIVYIVTNGNARQIILPQCVLRQIVNYLSKQDVINLILAYSTNSYSTIEEDELSFKSDD